MIKHNIYTFQDLILKTRKVHGLKTKGYRSIGKYPIIDQGRDFIAGHTDDESSLYNDSLPVVIFGDHTLALKYVDFPFCVGADGTQILRPNTEIILGKFLYYAIKNLNITSLGYSRHFKVLKEAKFNVPSLEEQKRIVRVLDAADALRQKRKQALALLDDYLKAVFLDMFGDNIRNGSEELRKYLKVIGGNAFKSTDFIDKGIPVIKIGTVNKGFFDLNNCSFLPAEFLTNKRNQKYVIHPGDLLISLTGTVGKADYGNVCFAVAEYPQYLLNQRVAKLDFDNYFLTKEFLFFFFKFELIKSQLTKISRGVRQANISNEDILALKINIPSLKSQQTWANIVQKVEHMNSAMNLQLVQLEMNFNALIQKAFEEKAVDPKLVSVIAKNNREYYFGLMQGIAAIVEAFGRTQVQYGEMVTAKCLYLLQEVFKVPFGVKFAKNNFGPYNPDIKKAIESGISKGKYFARKNSCLVLGVRSEGILKESHPLVFPSRNAMESLLEHFKHAPSKRIELIATVCKAIEDSQSTDVRVIQRELADWKTPGAEGYATKAEKFSDSVAEELAIITRLGWDKMLLRSKDQ